MDVQDLIREYETKTNEDLLRLALDSKQLTDQAKTALANVLAMRHLSGTEQLSTFREEEQQRRAEQERNPGTLFLIHPFGFGRKRFGKADYAYNSDTGIERFRTTIFLIIFFIPLVPLGTYLAEKKRDFFTSQIIFLEKCPLDWEQVLRVWIVAAASLLALICIFRLLPHLL